MAQPDPTAHHPHSRIIRLGTVSTKSERADRANIGQEGKTKKEEKINQGKKRIRNKPNTFPLTTPGTTLCAPSRNTPRKHVSQANPIAHTTRPKLHLRHIGGDIFFSLSRVDYPRVTKKKKPGNGMGFTLTVAPPPNPRAD